MAQDMPTTVTTTNTVLCPRFHYAVELVGRRWTGAILQSMLNGAIRFSDITSSVQGLSDRLLSERLRDLETEGIVSRTVIPDRPVRIEYRLTEKGQALAPVLESIGDWAETWIPADVAEETCSERDAVATINGDKAPRGSVEITIDPAVSSQE